MSWASTHGASVYIPAGRYRCEEPVVVRDARALHMYGDGIDMTILVAADGAQLEALLDVQGSLNSTYEDFTLGCCRPAYVIASGAAKVIAPGAAKLIAAGQPC